MMYSYGIGQVKHHDIILGAQYSNQQLLDAVENANWCGYFHQTENYELRFDDECKKTKSYFREITTCSHPF